MARSRSMQILTDTIKQVWPGVTVYGLGGPAHQLRISDHNEDDTAGSRPAQTDVDANPEHRALDVMLGPAFSRADGYALVEALTRDARVWYLIFDRWLWSRTYGWVRRAYQGENPHTDHVHISGEADYDEHAGRWPRVEEIGEVMTPELDARLDRIDTALAALATAVEVVPEDLLDDVMHSPTLGARPILELLKAAEGSRRVLVDPDGVLARLERLETDLATVLQRLPAPPPPEAG